MNKFILFFSAIWLCIATTPPVNAQHASPASTAFKIYGTVTIEKGPISICFLDIEGSIRSDVGLLHSGHATGGDIAVADIASGDPACALFSNTPGAWGFDILTYNGSGTGSGTGQMVGLDFGWCANSTPIPFTISNTGPGASTIEIDTIVGGCWMYGVFDADFNIAP